MSNRKHWAVLVYISADNNLYEQGKANLKQMLRAELGDKAHVVAQIDGRRVRTKLYELSGSGATLQEHLRDTWPNINAGSAGQLEKFLKRAIQEYEADHYAVVLWGHGSGLDENIFWDRPDLANNGNRPIISKAPIEAARTPTPQHVAASGCSELSLEKRAYLQCAGIVPKRAFQGRVLSAIQNAHQLAWSEADLKQLGIRRRKVLSDYAAGKAISNPQLRKVLQEAQDLARKHGGTVEILGMDACLMGMIELAYEFRCIPIMVASQTGIPSDGWPYTQILNQLKSRPDMNAKDFAAAMVAEFTAHYHSAQIATVLSLSDSSSISELVNKTDGLARQLIEALDHPLLRQTVFLSRFKAQDLRVNDHIGRDYADLYDFCRVLEQHIVPRSLERACNAVMEAIRECVISSDYTLKRYRGANGLSVYFPSFPLAPRKNGGNDDGARREIARIERALDTRYNELQFAEAKWDDFLLSAMHNRRTARMAVA